MKHAKVISIGLKACLGLLLGLLILPYAAIAASADEVIAMTDAGIPPETIIDVIDATGADELLDTDTIISLMEYGVDNDVIEYLLELTDDDTKVEVSGYERWGSESEYRPNYAGGPGFNHNGDNYDSYSDGYWDNDRETTRGAQYYRPYGSGITVYEPPVWVYGRNNNYYIDPNRYYYNDYYNGYYPGRGSWNNGTYVIYNNGWNNNGWYDPYYYGHGRGHGRHNYNDYWYNGCGTGLNGHFGYDRYRDGWFSDFDGWYHNDGFGIHISF